MLPSEYLVCCDHWSTSRCRLDYVRLFDARTSLILTRLSSMCICTVPLHKWWLDNTVEILAYFSSDWSDRLFCWELQYLPISSFFVDCLANLHFLCSLCMPICDMYGQAKWTVLSHFVGRTLALIVWHSHSFETWTIQPHLFIIFLNFS